MFQDPKVSILVGGLAMFLLRFIFDRMIKKSDAAADTDKELSKKIEDLSDKFTTGFSKLENLVTGIQRDIHHSSERSKEVEIQLRKEIEELNQKIKEMKSFIYPKLTELAERVGKLEVLKK